MRRFTIIFILLIFMLGGVYLNREIKNTQTELANLQAKLNNQQHILVYFIENTPTDFLLVPASRVVEKATPELALEFLIAGPSANEALDRSLPKETQIRSIHVENMIATVDFTDSIIDFFNGGSLLESLLVEAIVRTLIQFENINQVQILINGQIAESIGGHVLIEGLLP